MDRLGVCYMKLERPLEAVSLLENALQVARHAIREDHDLTGDSLFAYWRFDLLNADFAVVTMNNLAVVYRMVGRLADAVVLAEKVLDCQRRFLTETHPDIGNILVC